MAAVGLLSFCIMEPLRSQVTAGSPCGCNGRKKNKEDKERKWVKDVWGKANHSIKRGKLSLVGRRGAG